MFRENKTDSRLHQNITYSKKELVGILIAASFASFLAPFFGAALNIAIPTISQSFAVSPNMLAMLTTTYLLSSVIFLVPAARLADIFGLLRVFTIGLIIGVIGTLLAPFSPSIGLLLICQVIIGIGFSCVISNAIALLSMTFPPEQRGFAIGVAVACVYLGLTAGPLLGGILTSMFGWSSVYSFVCIICVCTILIARISVRREIILTPGEPFDWKGAILYCLVIFSLLYGLIHLSNNIGAFLVIGGCALLLLFIKIELKAEYPAFAIRLFKRNRAFTLGNIVTVINYGATYAVSFFMSLYLQVIGVLTPAEAGIVMVSLPIVQMIFSPVAGRLSDTISARVLMTAGMSVTTLGMFLLVQIGEQYNQVWVIATLALLGLGVAFFAAPNVNLVLSSVPRKDNGSANSIHATMRQIGMVVSMALATSFITLSFGGTVGLYADQQALISAMHLTFGCGAALCFIGAVVSWFAKKEDERVIS
ncbi:MAG: MFS transporter [Methanomicrobiales archaeon]|jgi:MFS family permease|nr:MFS transporter [Methanomicrobiales archaeon]